MLNSTVLPGSGLRKIEKKKSFYILGLLRYTAIRSSIYFYTQGEKSYNQYKKESDPIKRIGLLEKANNHNQNAGIAGLSAAGIWLVNYFWFTLKWNKKKTKSMLNNKISFQTNINPYQKQTIFILSYDF